MNDNLNSTVRRALAALDYDPDALETTTIPLEPVTDQLIDRLIAEAGSAREAVRELLLGQVAMLHRQHGLVERCTSTGYDRGLVRRCPTLMAPPTTPPPLDLWWRSGRIENRLSNESKRRPLGAPGAGVHVFADGPGAPLSDDVPPMCPHGSTTRRERQTSDRKLCSSFSRLWNGAA